MPKICLKSWPWSNLLELLTSEESTVLFSFQSLPRTSLTKTLLENTSVFFTEMESFSLSFHKLTCIASETCTVNKSLVFLALYFFTSLVECEVNPIDHPTQSFHSLPPDTDKQNSSAQPACVCLSQSHLTATNGGIIYWKNLLLLSNNVDD